MGVVIVSHIVVAFLTIEILLRIFALSVKLFFFGSNCVVNNFDFAVVGAEQRVRGNTATALPR